MGLVSATILFDRLLKRIRSSLKEAQNAIYFSSVKIEIVGIKPILKQIEKRLNIFCIYQYTY